MGEIWDPDNPPTNPQQIRNTSFDSGANWYNVFGHWYISTPAGYAKIDAGIDAYNTALRGGTVKTKSYVIKIKVDRSDGSFKVGIGNSFGPPIGSPGTYTFTVVPNDTDDLEMFQWQPIHHQTVDWITCYIDNPICDDLLVFFEDFNFIVGDPIYYDVITEASDRNVFRAAVGRDNSHILVKFGH